MLRADNRADVIAHPDDPDSPSRGLVIFARTLRSAAGGLALSTLVLVGCGNLSRGPATTMTRAGRVQAGAELSGTPGVVFAAALPSDISSVFVRFPQTPIA